VTQLLLDDALGAISSEKSGSASLPTARPRVGFVSLGCPKNLVDSEVMMGLLDRAGAEMTTRPEDAEILVVNTCSFIDAAKQESVDAILEMAQHKVSGNARKLIVAGCLVERYRDEIQKNIPEVDAVIGTGELEQILAAAGLEAPGPAEKSPSPFTILTSEQAARAEGNLREQQGRFSRNAWDGAEAHLPQYLYDHTTPRLLATKKASAYIKIAEGCDHPCSFCIIPNLRGKFRSRRFESVVAEAENLIAQGVREITLIGQDTTCYGEDLGMKDGLAQLLDSLAAIPGLFSTDAEESVTALRAFGRLLTREPLAAEDSYLVLGTAAAAPPRVRQGLLNRTLDHDTLLARLRSPVLITHGLEDEVILPVMADYNASTVRHAQTSYYPRTGHAPFWENPARFNAELRSFAASL